MPRTTKNRPHPLTWDKAIETVEKLIENSKAQKKALMQQLLTGKRRLPGFEREWEEVHLVDICAVNPKKLACPKDEIGRAHV